jgi:hypothetical protein
MFVQKIDKVLPQYHSLVGLVSSSSSVNVLQCVTHEMALAQCALCHCSDCNRLGPTGFVPEIPVCFKLSVLYVSSQTIAN